MTGFVVGDLSYRHVQGAVAATWDVVHNLGKKPSVTVLDSSSRVVHGDVVHINDNRLTITFSAPFSGVAHLN